MEEELILSISGLKKVYKKGKSTVVANNNISLKIKPNEVIGIVGENGSGKTTLLKQIMGLTTPTNGSVVFNPNIVNSQQLGYMSQHRVDVFEHLTMKEALFFSAQFKRIDEKKAKESINSLIDFFGLENHLNKSISSLSGGYHQILDFCIAVLGESSLLILDEPLNNLDPILKKKIISYLSKKINDDKLALIFVSHNLEEIESIVNRVLIFKDGKIIEDCTPKEAKAKYDQFIYFVVNSPQEIKTKKLETFASINNFSFSFKMHKLVIKIPSNEHSKLWQYLSMPKNIDINNINFRILTGTLENVYLSIFDKKTEIV